MLDDSEKFFSTNYNIVKERTKGDIFVGKQIIYGSPGVPFFLKVEDLSRHTAIIGPSGKGKTRLAIQIITEIINKDLGNVWIFDFHGEYSFLSKYGFILIRPSSFVKPIALNIFNVQTENPLNYSYFLSRLLLEAIKRQDYELTPQMERALYEAVLRTVSSPHVFIRNPIGFIKNLVEWKIKTTELGLVSSLSTFHAIVNRLHSLFSGPMGNVLWVLETNVDIQQLLRRNVIFDLSLLTRKGALKSDLIVLINVILRLLYNHLVGRKSDKRIFLFVEEARYIVPWRARKSTADTTALEDFAILSRKYGLSLVTITQSFNSISEDILNNVGTIFFFGSEDIKEIKELDHEKNNKIMGLPPRYAVVQLSEIPAKVLIEVNKVDPDKIFNEVKEEDFNGVSELDFEYKPIPMPFDELVSEFEAINDSQQLVKRVTDLVKQIRRITNFRECDRVGKIAKNLVLNFFIQNGFLKPKEFNLVFQKIRDNPRNILIDLDGREEIRKILEKKEFRECIRGFFAKIFEALKIKDNKIYEYEIEDIISNIIVVYRDFLTNSSL